MRFMFFLDFVFGKFRQKVHNKNGPSVTQGIHPRIDGAATRTTVEVSCHKSYTSPEARSREDLVTPSNNQLWETLYSYYSADTHNQIMGLQKQMCNIHGVANVLGRFSAEDRGQCCSMIFVWKCYWYISSARTAGRLYCSVTYEWHSNDTACFRRRMPYWAGLQFSLGACLKRAQFIWPNKVLPCYRYRC